MTEPNYDAFIYKINYVYFECDIFNMQVFSSI